MHSKRKTIWVFIFTNKKIRRKTTVLWFILSFTVTIFGKAPEKLTWTKYHHPKEISGLIKSWTSSYGTLTRRMVIGKSAGGRELTVLRIAATPKGNPDVDARYRRASAAVRIIGLHI